jgi:Zn-dependent membrane protease YugP
MLYLISVALMALLGPNLWARHVLHKYDRQAYFSGNGLDLAKLLLEHLNLRDVKAELGDIPDHYDPQSKTIRLSRRRCGRNTLTAVVVAAHEVGHAIQDQAGYRPLRTRTRLIGSAVKIERVGAAIMVGVPLFTILTRVPAAGLFMFLGGLATLGMPVLIHILTLPCEFDASFKRALPLLTSGRYIPEEDIPAARRILLACALTYVANSLLGLLNVWRWIRVLRR